MSLVIVILVSGGAFAGTLIAHVIANKRRVTARLFTVLQNSPSSVTSRGHVASKRLCSVSAGDHDQLLYVRQILSQKSCASQFPTRTGLQRRVSSNHILMMANLLRH